MSTATLEKPEQETGLSKITKVESEIIRLKTEYSGLTIAGVEDKKGLLAVSTARKTVKALRVEVEHTRKSLVEDSVKWQKTVNATAKDITTKLEEIEKPLQKLEDDHYAEKERILRERTKNRAQVITSLDAKFDGVAYSLGGFSIPQAELESLSNDEFQTRVELAEAENQKILEARLETERLAKIEADRIEAERVQKEEEAAEIKRQQEEAAAELKRQQDELAAERKRIDDEKAEIEAEKKRIQDEKDAAEKAEKDRIAAEAAEKKRLEDLEAARVEAAEKARIAAENKAKADAEAKAEADRIAKEKEARKLERRPDIQKQNDMISQIQAIVGSFSYKTKEGKKMQSEFLEGLNTLIETVCLKES